jgi:acyl-CoA thioesterase FadM
MHMLLRALLTLIFSKSKSRIGLLEECVLNMRVWPTDLDIFMHVNNGRYLSIMDLGRLELLVRMGLWGAARQRGWYPVVGAVKIIYKRSLKLFDPYTLTTKIIGWDDRWFYIEQIFRKGSTIIAIAKVKGLIRDRSGVIPTKEALSAIGSCAGSPPFDEAAQELKE